MSVCAAALFLALAPSSFTPAAVTKRVSTVVRATADIMPMRTGVLRATEEVEPVNTMSAEISKLRGELEAANKRITELQEAASSKMAAVGAVVVVATIAMIISDSQDDRLITGAIELAAAGALLLGGGDKEAASPRQKKVSAAARIRALKTEGAAVVARRAEMVAMLEEKRTAMLAPAEEEQQAAEEEEEQVGTVTPMIDLEEVFEQFDADNSGTLDAEELKQVLVAAGRASDDETVAEQMKVLDTNNDGVISKKEFSATSNWWEQKGASW